MFIFKNHQIALDFKVLVENPFGGGGVVRGQIPQHAKKYFDPDNMIQSTFDDSESVGCGGGGEVVGYVPPCMFSLLSHYGDTTITCGSA